MCNFSISTWLNNFKELSSSTVWPSSFNNKSTADGLLSLVWDLRLRVGVGVSVWELEFWVFLTILLDFLKGCLAVLVKFFGLSDKKLSSDCLLLFLSSVLSAFLGF